MITNTPLSYVIQLCKDFIAWLKTLDMTSFGAPLHGWSVFTFMCIVLIGTFTITIIGGDDDD